jgi:hypothetical protein
MSKEMTFEQEQEVTRILEGYRSNPSNSNKFRYELFAYINELLVTPTTESEEVS